MIQFVVSIAFCRMAHPCNVVSEVNVVPCVAHGRCVMGAQFLIPRFLGWDEVLAEPDLVPANSYGSRQ